jgi:membrane-associated phospholipid phosphatase
MERPLRTKLPALLLLAGVVTTPLASADIVTDWNQAALDTIRARSTPPPAAARNLAIVHVAIYDAVNGVRRTHEPYLVRGDVSSRASIEAAATSAAHDALVALYPADQSTFDALHTSILGGIPGGLRKEQGIAWGKDVAAQILAARANDGSTATAPFPGSQEPGQWRPTISFGGVVRPALLPLWGNVTPFALTSGTQFRPPSPPALGSRRYAFEVNFAQRFGSVDSTARTVEQTEIAQFWGYGPGTATPPGHWNQIAQVVAVNEGKSLAKNARLFALLNIALADAAIVSWDCKYIFNLWRPITAIQLADQDGNPATAPDPAWMPLLETPPFPEYTSGHSTFSGAAAVVLASFYHRDRVRFVVGSDDLPGVVRFYDSFSHAALESGMSRVYGGIHFMSANLHGLLTGAQTGAYVMRNVLRPRGPHREDQ